LKYGRNQESEADEMGLYLMAMAGYDPREAIPFWNRMEAASSGARQPEFFLLTQILKQEFQINKDLPKALEYYKAAGGKCNNMNFNLDKVLLNFIKFGKTF
jgi:hypothetical protein